MITVEISIPELRLLKHHAYENMKNARNDALDLRFDSSIPEEVKVHRLDQLDLHAKYWQKRYEQLNNYELVNQEA